MSAAPLRKRWLTRGDWLAIAVFAGVTFLMFWQGLIQPAEMIREDAAYYYQPYYTFAATEIQAGRFPLWNPYTTLGIPFHAGLQASLLYPLRWHLFFMDYVPGWVSLTWLHYFLTAVAVHALLRVALRVGPLAACVGALSVAFGGFAQGHLSHPTYFMAYPWFFGTLLFCWLGVQRDNWRWLLGAAGCVGLLALIGAVHLLLILAVMLGTFLVYYTICELVLVLHGQRRWPALIRPTVIVAGAALIGGLLGAVQLLPARALEHKSVRTAATWDFINMGCAHPVRNTQQLVVPFYYGNHRLGYWGEFNYHGMAHYTGTAVLLLACVGVFHLGRNRHLWFLVVLAIVGFLIGAGKYLPFYRVLYECVPGFSVLRNPTRIFWITDIALAGLAAVAIQRTLVDSPSAAQRRTRWVVLAAGSAIITILALSLAQLSYYADHASVLLKWMDDNPNVFKGMWYPFSTNAAQVMPAAVMRHFDPAAWTNIAATVLSVGLLLALYLGRRRLGRLTAAALVLLLVGDLFATSLGMVQYETKYHVTTSTPPRAQWLQEHLGPYRYANLEYTALPTDDDQVVRNAPMLYRLRSTEGIGGGILDVPEHVAFAMSVPMFPPLLDVASVRYLLAPGEIKTENAPQLRVVHRDERYIFYENRTARPLVWLAREVVPLAEIKGIVRVLGSGPRDRAVVSGDATGVVRQSAATRRDVTDVTAVPGRWDITTVTDAPTQLIVAEGWDTDWRCTVNGTPAHVYQTNGEFLSCVVPAGESTAVFEYAPPSFRHGILISVLTAVVYLAVVLLVRLRRL